MRQARLVVWLGPASEPYLRRVLNNPAAEVRWADLPELVKLPTRSAMHQQGHDHEGDGHQHHHSGGIDPHIWWSVPNAILLARTLEQRISRDRPDWSATLQNNRQQLEIRLNRQLQEQRARFATGFKPFLLAHDAFFYLEEDLGIASEAALMLDPENKPGVKHLLALQRRVAEQNVGCVITGALVPASLIDKIDTRPPLLRLALDELGWDSPGQRYSDWLAQAYVKVAECVGLSAS
jgi:zinc transport system substrate-binding protein